jgi:hypothetical protein
MISIFPERPGTLVLIPLPNIPLPCRARFAVAANRSGRLAGPSNTSNQDNNDTARSSTFAAPNDGP